jgi:N-acetylneuraminic acid mutarotase
MWQQKESLPAPGRESAIGFSINASGYIGGGVTDTFTLHHDFWEYDPQIDAWEQKANIPVILAGQGAWVAFSIDGKGYVQASFNNDNFWEYDPTNDRWTKKAPFPGGDLLYHVAFAIGLKGYLGTGYGSSANRTEFWEYSPSDDRWIQKADFPGTRRNGAVGFSVGGKGYIGLGNASGTLPRDFWAYDPGADSWTGVDSCGYGADGAFAFAIGSKGYVGTGLFAAVGEFWEYDPSTISLPNITSLLQQGYPNRFNPATNPKYDFPKSSTHSAVRYQDW